MPTQAKRRMLLPLCIACLFLVVATSGQYLVEILEVKNGTNANETHRRPILRCDATGASFGEDVMTFSFGLQTVGCALPTRPQDACSNATMPEYNRTLCAINFAVVPRGNCSFAEKAYYAQGATPTGYQAIILFNDPHQAPIPMAGEHKYADKVQIPVVMVTYSCMESLLHKFSANKGYLVTIIASPGYVDLIKYLVPFVAIVGFCFIVLFISLVIRLCRERRRMARKRLSRSNLKKIPTRKYKKGDAEETCAICLEDFAEADKLRILPCKHAYHCKCIDPWLTKSRKVCPVCKRKVGPSRGSDSSDSDSERPTTSTYTTTVTRESDRLLRNAQPMGMSSDNPEFAAQSTSTSSQGENSSLSPARRDDETSDGGSVLMRASSFLNLHSPYPSLSQQPSTSGSLHGGRMGSANDDVGVGRRMKIRLAKMRCQLTDMLQRGEQRLRGVGGVAGSGSNTLLVDNVDYGDTEPDYAGSSADNHPSAILPIDASLLRLETHVDIESAGGLPGEEERPTSP